LGVDPPERAGGLILAGGASRRMGVDKAWLPFGKCRMLAAVVRVLREILDPLVVVAAPGQILPPLPASVQVAYDPARGLGPLQGLVTGLAALDGRAEVAFLAPCDAPLIRKQFVQHMIGLSRGQDIVVPCEGAYFHPVSAVYRTAVLPRAEAALASGRRRIDVIYPDCHTLPTPVDDLRRVDPDLRSLLNINGPEDYLNALRTAGFVAELHAAEQRR
jgi:molybdopterin-guanine dinucleotide biosynthesis protein A